MIKFIIAVLIFAVTMTAGAGVIVDSITGADNKATMNAEAGQTFTTGTLGTENKLEKIEVLGASGSAGNSSSVSARLWVDSDQDFGSWGVGDLVATSANSQVITGTDTTFTFNFSNEVLSDDTVYVLSFYDGSSDHVQFRSALNSGADSLSDGALFASGSQPFSGAFDATIRVSTIPEPATLGLFGLLGSAYLIRRRLIRK